MHYNCATCAWKSGILVRGRKSGERANNMGELFKHIVELALKEGLWACLFLYLFRRMLTENRERETAYQATIKELTTNINMEIVEMGGKLDRVLATTTAMNSAGRTAVSVSNTTCSTAGISADTANASPTGGKQNHNNPEEDREKGQNDEDDEHYGHE